MRLNLYLTFSFFIGSIAFVVAQANLLNAKIPQEVGKFNEQQLITNDNAPLEYGYVDDRDVMWSKTIWEIVDLDERINFPYYYPTDTLNLGTDRRSLFDVLLNNIRKENITEVYGSSYFLEKKSVQDVNESLISIDTLEMGIEQLNAGEELDPQFVRTSEITSRQIRQYKIKGTWYFDKRLGELKYRMLGICPVAPDVSFLDAPEEEQDLVELFWVWFPNARSSLNRYNVFNHKNASQPITFDLMLNTRRFNSIIYKEENTYEDRLIADYIYEDALRQLLESERIRNVIRDYEQDMWSN